MNSKVYFLSYYEPFGGLCNQLYLITNHIHDALLKGAELYIHKINVDIFHKKRVLANLILDIEKTNDNIEQFCGIRPLVTEQPDYIEHIPNLCIYPVSSVELLNCLEFHGNILKQVHKVRSNFPEGYYAVHFRLDIDAIIHYTFGKEVYTTFMNKSTNDALEYFYSLDKKKIKGYCSFLMKQYYTLISKIGFNKPWYICTTITKSTVHSPMVVYLKKLIDFIVEHGTYYIPETYYEEREINALIDLLVLRDSDAFVGFEGSSFSEGYCKKVNSIRAPNKMCYFVKEFQIL